MMTYNPAELATWSEAWHIAQKLKTVGGGVKPQTGNRETSGTYIPQFVGYPAPQDGKSYWLHFRFANGKEGHNVGLIRELFAKYPKAYVINFMKTQVEVA